MKRRKIIAMAELLPFGFKPQTDEERWIVCERKRQFGSFREAKSNAKKKGINVYQCPVCFQFHLTHKGTS